MKAKKVIIATLFAIGLVAVCGEATEDIASTLAVQLIIFAASWGAAVGLAKKWHMFNNK